MTINPHSKAISHTLSVFLSEVMGEEFAAEARRIAGATIERIGLEYAAANPGVTMTEAAHDLSLSDNKDVALWGRISKAVVPLIEQVTPDDNTDVGTAHTMLYAALGMVFASMMATVKSEYRNEAGLYGLECIAGISFLPLGGFPVVGLDVNGDVEAMIKRAREDYAKHGAVIRGGMMEAGHA